jgi:hypothetical protein
MQRLQAHGLPIPLQLLEQVEVVGMVLYLVHLRLVILLLVNHLLMVVQVLLASPLN